MAGTEALDLIHSAHNSAFLRPSQLPVPSTLILAPGSRIASVIRGPAATEQLLPIIEALSAGEEAWQTLSHPTGGGGTWVHQPDTIFYVNIAKEMILRDQIREAADYLMAQRQWLAVEGKKFAEMLMLGGTKLLEKGEGELGTELLEAAVEAGPDLATARNNLAVALLQSGRGDDALPHLRAAIAADPDFIDPKVNLARYLAGSGSSAEARELAVEVLKSGYHPGAIRVKAQLLASSGQNFELHAVFQEMVENEPGNPSTWVNLAKLQLSTGDRNAALSSFERALALRPDDAELTRIVSSLKNGQ